MSGYDDYLREWRVLHGLEGDRMVGGFVEWYLRLPYAIARPIARQGISPNLVTLVGLLIAAASLPAYLAGGSWPAVGGGVVLCAGLFDQVDGAVAVLSGRASTFGGIWDSTIDRLSDAVMLIGPACWLTKTLDGRTRTFGLVGVTAAGGLAFLLEYVRARCQAVGYVNNQVVTPAERPTRVVMVVVFGLLGGLAAATRTERTGALVWAWGAWVLSTLTLVSVVMLLLDARRRADRARPTTAAPG